MFNRRFEDWQIVGIRQSKRLKGPEIGSLFLYHSAGQVWVSGKNLVLNEKEKIMGVENLILLYLMILFVFLPIWNTAEKMETFLTQLCTP